MTPPHNLADLQNFAQSLIESGLAPISRVAPWRRSKAYSASALGCGTADQPGRGIGAAPFENRLTERILREEDVHRILAAHAKPRDQFCSISCISPGCASLKRASYAGGIFARETKRPDHRVWQKGRTRAIALHVPLWSELIALRSKAGKEDPVFPSRSGKPLDRGRVRMIVRWPAKRVGIADLISPHWLRHAHASHALDHGAPIHPVQATLGP